MINILNNHLKFKEKYLSLHKSSNVNPKNFNNILKKRIKNIYSFSYNLNKFSKKNPTLFFKGLPYLTGGYSITETEKILKLSPLSRKGFDILKATPKAKNSFLYSNSKLSKTIATTRPSTSHLKSNTLTVPAGGGRIRTYSALASSLGKLKEGGRDTFQNSKEPLNVYDFRKTSQERIEKNINKNLVTRSRSKPENWLGPKKNKRFKKYNPLINWIKGWGKKKAKYTKLGTYKLQDSDKNWFSVIDKIRQVIKSRYVFDPLLARSQSVNYFFNKDNKKINLNFIYKILKYFFTSLSALISKPVFIFSPDKVNIRLFYYTLPSEQQLLKDTKEKRLIRKRGKLYEEKKNRRKFRKIMNDFRMKVFIAKWKESNNLIRLPSFSDTFSKIFAFSKYASYDLISAIPSLSKVNSQAITALKLTGAENPSSLPVSPLSLTAQNQFAKSLPSTATKLTMTDDYGSRLSESNDGYLSSLALSLSSKAQSSPSPLRLSGRRLSWLGLKEGAERTGVALAVGVKDKSLQFLKARYAVPSTIVSLNKGKFKYLVFILEKVFNKTVVLDLVRLKYPYHDSNILVQVLGLSSQDKNFRVMMRKLLYIATIKNPAKMIRKQTFSILPSYLSGIKVKLAGRLITQRVVPRFTVQSVQMGSLARGKVSYVDTSRLTHKSKRGAFSFTVTTSHIFENYK